ncbi:MAG: sigma-54 dependent transcriptional regulator [Nitrospira sp.]
MVAKAIHFNSDRKDAPFIPVNCAAIPEQLLESELFGHMRGAFTDAKIDKRGLFEEAQKGTLFLDEISEPPLMLQAKILRAIQEKEIRRVGATKPISVDVRIIAATNLNLNEEVKGKRFREDLYYRLNVIELKLPPLRERREDIPLLVEAFLKKCGNARGKEVKGVSEAALAMLMDYAWPGNVRELENVIERAVTLSRGEKISPDDLPPAVQGREEIGVCWMKPPNTPCPYTSSRKSTSRRSSKRPAATSIRPLTPLESTERPCIVNSPKSKARLTQRNNDHCLIITAGV